MSQIQEEIDYRWFDAAKRYKKMLQSKPDDLLFAAECSQKIGFCLNLASRQTQTLEEFKRLRQQAVAAYETAAANYGQATNPEAKVRSKECTAIAAYTSSWLASDSSERGLLLDKCFQLGKETCRSFRTLGDEVRVGEMCNVLSLCLLDQLSISPTSEEKRRIVQMGLDEATNAISTLSRLENKGSLLVSYSAASLLSWYYANITEQEDERKELIRKCLDFSKEAIALSSSITDLYAKAMSMWAGALSALYFTDKIDSSNDYAKRMLEYATTIRDNYFKGIAFYLLAHIADWRIEVEADQDRRKNAYEEIMGYATESIHNLELMSQDSPIADTYLYLIQSYSCLSREFGLQPQEKLAFAGTAVKIGEKGIEHAFRSGSPDALGSVLHALSKALQYYSKLEPRKEEKIELLKEALGCRKDFITTVENAFPSNFWTSGVGFVYVAQIEADLAKLETENRADLLREAVSHMEKGVARVNKWISSRDVPSLTAIVAGFEDNYGMLLNERFLLTGEKEDLSKANKVYHDAAEKFRMVDLPSRVAESYWKIARNLDVVGEHQSAAGYFENAFAGFKAAAQKIPQFSDFYLDYSTYMKSWSEIQKAKLAHYDEDYSSAVEHYERASSLLKQSILWSYLSSNFHAWAHIEYAEDLSRKEESQEAIKSFEQAILLFIESEKTLRTQLSRIDKVDEKDLVTRLVDASNLRQEYSRGRIEIEEAKILDKKGDHSASSDRYKAAAEVFSKISQTDSQQIRKEVTPLIYLCQAWQKMTLAEARNSPMLYEEAAELFKQANSQTQKESASLLALAHSSFCRALEHGTEFEITRNMTMYLEAKKHLDTAANYYLKAGFDSASEYAKGTQRLFDAYVYMNNAKKESDPDKEAKFYVMAEKVLQVSAESYNKANHSEKTAQVQKLIQKVKEERELALSLSEVLHAPTATSSTASFATISLSEEKAVGLERFEHADIQARLILQGESGRVGENLKLEVQIVNVGKEAVSLTRIDNILSPSFQIVGKPDNSSLDGSALLIKGTRLNPLEMNALNLTLKPLKRGSIEISPKLVCVDENGRKMHNEPEPKVLNILEAVLPGRISTGYQELDNLLLGGIPKTYAVVLTSPSCDERELLVNAFLKAGAKPDQVTFYITEDPGEAKTSAQEHQSSFYVFVCNPRADVMIKNLTNVFKMKGVESLTDIDIALVKAFRMLDTSQKVGRRACIEIVSDVLLQHHAVITRKWLSGVLAELKSKEFTTLAVVNPQMHPTEEVQAILGLFEGEIRVSEIETSTGVDKVLRVRKLHNERYLDNEIILSRETLES